MFDPKEWRMYGFKGTSKQNGAGGGGLILNISPGKGNMMIPLYGTIGQNDYAAGRTVRVKIMDATPSQLATLFIAASIDNVVLPLFFITENAVAGSDPQVKGSDNWTIAGTDILRVQADSLVQNEELTLTLRALVYGILPTVTTTDSGGTAALTTAYNKFL